MRRIIAAAALLAICAPALRADTCIRLSRHTEAYYHNGVMDPAVDSEIEMWMGDGMVASMFDGRKFLFDLKADSITIISPADSYYVRTALPLDLTLIVDEAVVPQLSVYPTVGEVEKLDRKKTVEGRECTGWKITTWVMYMGGKVNETERISWVTTDLPFDWHGYKKVRRALLKLSNYSDELLDKIMAADGLEIAAESTLYNEGKGIKTTISLKSMTDEKAPEGLYAVPDDFTRRERLPRR